MSQIPWRCCGTTPSCVSLCGPGTWERLLHLHCTCCLLLSRARAPGSPEEQHQDVISLLTPLVKTSCKGFPGGAVVENLPAKAGDTGSSPGLRGSHMPRSNWAREPQLLSLRVWSLCSATREATTVRGPRTAMKSGPRSPQLEKALTQKRRPNTAQKINK